MSSTITTTTTSLSVLADYEVHHSGEENVPARIPSQPQADQPAWPTHHRRMPAYRPANRELDLTQRPAGNGHPAEFAFIQIMLHGVWLNASVSRLWRFTGGRINDKIFHYQVGGEW
ncbi:hypothetical protein N7448_005638 [Penicillium atrosanguineum]|uniref:Uncharacterized protein n=1 Tax=Penicillium atrosanguineum TaxID=1132637 RepID=A0A9W9PN33_9EURO|nr:uncharacterized protein N7443_009379 [Penicillium atrosanguineum]KAJ5126335.1 hypothetical protein N7526_008512 [Penicillium atrosanguineum]KAJ5137084.1 hypothetical protein N7448_005638 [Penicillium atrosanguineum]KAJ5293426.1 hypothetical protein N7443_009379 [Penicillium atrosanguineum]KAJ5302541.1 hypothetical protein N7476_009340 [Penicillium atrosanguineum]